MAENATIANKKTAPGKYLAGLLFLGLAIAIAAYYRQVGRNEKGIDSEGVHGDRAANQVVSNRAIEDTAVLLRTQDGVVSVDARTGQTGQVGDIEQEILEKFSGLPNTGKQGQEDVEKSVVMVSHDGSMAIVNLTAYRAGSQDDEDAEIVKSEDYLCDIARGNCQLTDILSKAYEGVGPMGEALVSLEAWDVRRGLLYMRLFDVDQGEYSRMLACSTADGTCQNASFAGSARAGVSVSAPQGLFSADLQRFVLLREQVDSTGASQKLELGVFERSDLSKPIATYDISGILGVLDNMQGSENIKEDITGLAWSSDGNKLVVATDAKIFLYEFATGNLIKLYDDAFSTADARYAFDGSSVAFSPDGRFVMFIARFATEDDESQPEESDEPDLLEKIDTQDGNRVSEVGTFVQSDFERWHRQQ